MSRAYRRWKALRKRNGLNCTSLYHYRIVRRRMSKIRRTLRRTVKEGTYLLRALNLSRYLQGGKRYIMNMRWSYGRYITEGIRCSYTIKKKA